MPAQALISKLHALPVTSQKSLPHLPMDFRSLASLAGSWSPARRPSRRFTANHDPSLSDIHSLLSERDAAVTEAKQNDDLLRDARKERDAFSQDVARLSSTLAARDKELAETRASLARLENEAKDLRTALTRAEDQANAHRDTLEKVRAILDTAPAISTDAAIR